MWKSYGIGEGTDVPWSTVESKFFERPHTLFVCCFFFHDLFFVCQGNGTIFECSVEENEFSKGDFIDVTSDAAKRKRRDDQQARKDLPGNDKKKK